MELGPDNQLLVPAHVDPFLQVERDGASRQRVGHLLALLARQIVALQDLAGGRDEYRCGCCFRTFEAPGGGR